MERVDKVECEVLFLMLLTTVKQKSTRYSVSEKDLFGKKKGLQQS